jgi:hypothetical protein
VTGSGVFVNQAFAGRAVEERDSDSRIFATRGSMTLLESGAKSGALGTVTRHCGSGLTHVLLRRRDIRHY